MLCCLKTISGYRIHAVDGDIGSVDNFYFEDQTWHIRYIVVDTGKWLPGRRVLLSPVAIEPPPWKDHKLPTNLTMQKVRESPDIDTNQSVSRQQEADLHAYYMWPPYWGADFGMLGAYPFGAGATFPSVPSDEAYAAEGEREGAGGEAHGDPHLRDMREVLDYSIQGLDGDVGDVDDFIMDGAAWTLRYLVVDTGAWLPGKKTLIPIEMVTRIDWSSATVNVNLPRQVIKTCLPFDPHQALDGLYEEMVKNHYKV